MRNQIKRKGNLLERIINHKLFKNKFYSVLIMLLGYITMHILNGDCTVFILTLMIGIPLFFAKKNYID